MKIEFKMYPQGIMGKEYRTTFVDGTPYYGIDNKRKILKKYFPELNFEGKNIASGCYDIFDDCSPYKGRFTFFLGIREIEIPGTWLSNDDAIAEQEIKERVKLIKEKISEIETYYRSIEQTTQSVINELHSGDIVNYIGMQGEIECEYLSASRNEYTYTPSFIRLFDRVNKELFYISIVEEVQITKKISGENRHYGNYLKEIAEIVGFDDFFGRDSRPEIKVETQNEVIIHNIFNVSDKSCFDICPPERIKYSYRHYTVRLQYSNTNEFLGGEIIEKVVK
jgi:hypothetical protein